MSAKNRILAIVPARGGSKRLPRKNVRPLGGKPLIAWTIDSARESGAGREVNMFPVYEYWLDIGRMDDFQRAQQVVPNP